MTIITETNQIHEGLIGKFHPLTGHEGPERE